MALRGNEKKLELTFESFTGLQEPKQFYPETCIEHLEKVGLQMIKPDLNELRYIVTRKRK